MTTQVLLLNQTCHPGCSVCPHEVAPHVAPADVGRWISKLGSACDEVYVGLEAFAQMESLPEVISACNARGLEVHLLTRGQVFDSTDDAAFALAELKQHGDFTVLIVADSRHWEHTDGQRLARFLEAVRLIGRLPELLYLKRTDEVIPPDLLAADAINQYVTMYVRPGEDLRAFLSHKGWKTVAEEDPIAGDVKVATPNGLAVRPGAFAMFFSGLVLETTHLCNARCSHCYTSCGPDKSAARMPLDKIKRVIADAAALPNLVKRCHVGGGEATIFWDEMLECLTHARDHGFINSIVTNGWWGKSPAAARQKVGELKRAGVENIEFSVDAMHQEYVSSRTISHIITTAKEQDVRITLRVCTTKSHRADAVLGMLSSEDQSGITVATSKVVSIGRAREAIPSADMWTNPGLPLGSCQSILNLTVVPNGDVFPCCAGSEICPSLKLGNAFERPLPELMKAVSSNIFARTLVHAGPAYFASLLQEAGFGDRLLPEYGGICHLCTQICSDPELSGAVQRKLDEKVLGMLHKVAAVV